MGEPNFELIPRDDFLYYGQSDLLGQITDELRDSPSSCFSRNVFAWYNSAYAPGNIDDTCVYQVDANKQLCIELYGDPEANQPSIGSSLDFLVDTAAALGRRDGRRLILNFCRLARRALIERKAPRV